MKYIVHLIVPLVTALPASGGLKATLEQALRNIGVAGTSNLTIAHSFELDTERELTSNEEDIVRAAIEGSIQNSQAVIDSFDSFETTVVQDDPSNLPPAELKPEPSASSGDLPESVSDTQPDALTAPAPEPTPVHEPEQPASANPFPNNVDEPAPLGGDQPNHGNN